MQIKATLIAALTLLLVGCGNDYDKAIGLYQYENKFTGSERVAEIKKDGDTYLFIENVLNNTDPMALSESDEGLSYRNTPLKLSEDGNTLYFGPINGTRISSDDLKVKFAAIKNDKKICKELREQVIANKSLEKNEWNAYVKDVRGKMPKGCRISEANERWF
ncbi:hypothetical protein [Pseudomonas sp. GOM6]|uniref:hypothetical protein n=1 Tax=Pseudomonas sp. GOM6 TaxID=3036944 RepID=UPI00240924F4|nr:hypothetical protein [Pseudomonas sp. GOM6]MDG1582339.1 hypothetical protein [Pseudomonas sp. GOM6]